MRYTGKHPKQDLGAALHLSGKQERKISNAILKIMDEVAPDRDGTISMDDLNTLIAPYIATPEEAYFAACSLMAYVQNALNIHLSNSN